MILEMNSLELLLLICVELGVNGAYELSTKCGMGVSLSSPVLQRLLKRHLLTCTTGARRSTRYYITEEGKSVLRDSVERAKSSGWYRELRRDAGCRGVLLAALYSGMKEAMECLDLSVEDLRSRQAKTAIDAQDSLKSLAREKDRFSQDPSQTNKVLLIGAANKALNTNLLARSIEMEIASLDSIRPIIEMLPVALPDLPGTAPLTVPSAK
jgi:hypothetical protein